MKNSKKLLIWIAKLILTCTLSIIIIACSKDDDTTPEQAINCNVDVADCLTNGERQTYFPYSYDGGVIVDPCDLSIRITFNASGTFSWFSDSDTDIECLEDIGFENFVGNWTLENNNTEIHITPPWWTNNGQTETVLTIQSLNESELVVLQQIDGQGIWRVVWRRI
ncbi:MAG: lipocalin family protein [Flavobacteriaceae bacterium]|nr:lipocalin family protein [Flavobacteriaceae bacterium]